eukprot:6201839-Pleurochrysis_carterae.AAC.1
MMLSEVPIHTMLVHTIRTQMHSERTHPVRARVCARMRAGPCADERVRMRMRLPACARTRGTAVAARRLRASSLWYLSCDGVNSSPLNPRPRQVMSACVAREAAE